LYGWGVNVFTSIALQCIVSVTFAVICLYTQQSTQLNVGYTINYCSISNFIGLIFTLF